MASTQPSSSCNGRDILAAPQIAFDCARPATRMDLAYLLEQQIAQQPDSRIGLVLVNVTSYHHVNTTLGYGAGRALIEQLCSTLQAQFRDIDIVMPLGHGQLALILPDLKNPNHALLAAAKVRRSIQHVTLDEMELSVMPTQGVAVFPVHADSAEKLVQRADIALGKTAIGHLPVQLADAAVDDGDNQLAMVQALEQAISENELVLNFQPQIEVSSGQPCAVEALSRWNSEQLGFVSPDVFISVAESCGLIKPLTVWSINTALKSRNSWHGPWANSRMAINLSAVLLHDSEIVELIQRALNIWNVQASDLVVEITEGAIMTDPERCLSTLNDLHLLGVQLSIDDFGTGYSSMSYLSKLPLDELKIDKSFVMNMMEDENNAKIVRTVIDLAHNLNLTVVAEGIENEATLEALKDLQCDFAQGYFISRPVPRADITQWYQNHMKTLNPALYSA